MIVRVCAAPKKPKENGQKTGCFDAEGKEIEYDKKIVMDGFRAHCGCGILIDIDKQEIIPRRIDGADDGFYAEIKGGKIFFGAFRNPIIGLHAIERRESACFDKNGNPIYIGDTVAILPPRNENGKIFYGTVRFREQDVLFIETEYGNFTVSFAPGECVENLRKIN